MTSNFSSKQMNVASIFKFITSALRGTGIANFTQKASSHFGKHTEILIPHKEDLARIYITASVIASLISSARKSESMRESKPIKPNKKLNTQMAITGATKTNHSFRSHHSKYKTQNSGTTSAHN